MHIDWIDRWKGLLIILVVAGHVFGGACHLCIGESFEAFSLLYKIIYTFHMPAFFWLAGMCWKAKAESLGSFAKKRAKRLLIPYAVFGIASIVVYFIAANGTHLFAFATDSYYQNCGYGMWWQPIVSLMVGNGWPNGEGFRCNSVLWFLPAMFSVLCFYWLVDRFVRNWRGHLAVAALLIVVACLKKIYGSIPLPFGLSCIVAYVPFVIFGRIVGRTEMLKVLRPGIRIVLYLVIAWMAFSLIIWSLPNMILAHVQIKWYLVFMLVGILGVVLSALTAQILSSRWLELCGRATLGIMLMHKFAVLMLQVKIPLVSWLSTRTVVGFWIANLMVLAISLAISFGMTLLIRKYAAWTIGEFRK